MDRKTVYHMALESVDSRYTGEWAEVIPRELAKYDVNVVTLEGDNKEAGVVTSGAFLNFTATNIWKNEQTNKLAILFSEGKIKNGDHIFFPDAWHPGILQAKYMAELLDIEVELSGYWHAGSYDPQDFLGRKIKNKDWSFNAERAYFYALDTNFFATDFHIDLMTNALSITDKSSIVRTGQPHYKLIESIYSDTKRDLILFPHRISEEKQPEIFRDLAKSLPQYEFIFCQEVTTCKADYHKLLSEAKIVFSANLQETLGISAMEGVLADAIPLLPNRLSYSEMYEESFLYPQEWTESFDLYVAHKDILISYIISTIESYDLYLDKLQKQKINLIKDYLTSRAMFDLICNK